MANVIKHKRGSGSDPAANNLVLGELAIRTDTGKLFTKMDSGAIAEIAGGGSDIAINTLSSSSATGGGSATFNGSAYRFTLSAPPNVSAAQLLVSINGVIQKPVAGTGQPSEGFSVDGTDIILGDAPATGSDFFILTFKSLGVSEPADNSVTSAKIVDGAIVNADINASAAIDVSKLSGVLPLAGGTLVGNLTITREQPIISFNDSTDNPDYYIGNIDGSFRVRDTTNNSTRLDITASTITTPNNLNVSDLLYVDAGNNRVGIGTTSPLAPLHVAHSGTSTAVGTNFISLRSGASGRDIGIQFADGATSAYVGMLGGAIYFADSGSSEKMRIDSSGRLQIGSTNNSSTGTKLVVGSGNNMAATALINTQDTDINALTLSNWDGATTSNKVLIGFDNSGIGSFSLGMPASSNALAFFGSIDGSSNERMRIDSAGRLVIGTASARSSGGGVSAHLQLEGTTSQGAELLITRNTADTYSPTLGLVKTRGTSVGSNTSVVDNDVLGTIQFRGADGSDIFAVGASIFARVNGTPSDGTDMPGELVFATTADGAASPTESMRIDSSGHVTLGRDYSTNPSNVITGVTTVRGHCVNTGTTDNDFAQLYLKNSSSSGNSSASIRGFRDDSNFKTGLRFYTHNNPGSGGDGDERMRIDSSGRLLIGTTNNSNGHISASNLAVQGADLAIFKDSGGDNSGVSGHKLKFVTQSGSLGEIDVLSEGAGGPSGRGGAMRFYTKANNTGSATERMRIDSIGRILVNTTSQLTYGGYFNIDASSISVNALNVKGSSTNYVIVSNSDKSSGNHIYFANAHGGDNNTGTITDNGSNVTYSTSSDYRIKENIVSISDGIARVKQLNPIKHTFKNNSSAGTVDGWLAHELDEVCPYAVIGEKDAVNEDGTDSLQGVDYGRISPLLTAALKEAIVKIEVLETKVAALEAK